MFDQVSLSRNRMYVNLISLENGDCVTTFKVGEDRFLNSLLVSDNGRLLVCGDESKRPCSLLVWDLQANHHEFITRLSAITGDGTYVACVCKVSCKVRYRKTENHFDQSLFLKGTGNERSEFHCRLRLAEWHAL